MGDNVESFPKVEANYIYCSPGVHIFIFTFCEIFIRKLNYDGVVMHMWTHREHSEDVAKGNSFCQQTSQFCCLTSSVQLEKPHVGNNT